MQRLSVVFLCVILTWSTVATAQTDGAASKPVTQTPDYLFEKAMDWVHKGKRDEARLMLQSLVKDFPNSKAAVRARAWLKKHPKLNQDGRTEMVISSTLMGTYLGTAMGFGLLPSKSRTNVLWFGLGGATAGLAASLLATDSNQVSNSQAELFSAAGTWGGINGFLLYDLTMPLDERGVFLSSGFGVLAGMTLGASLWPFLDVEEGAAAFAYTGSLISLELLVLMNFAIAGENVFSEHEKTGLLTLLLPANAMLIGGYFLGKKLDWSRSDIRYISLGAFLGNVLGGALVLSMGGGQEFEGSMWTIFGGVVAGVGTTIAILQPWKKPGHDVSAPKRSTGALLSYTDGDLYLDVPGPVLLPERSPSGDTGFRVVLPLAAGNL